MAQVEQMGEGEFQPLRRIAVRAASSIFLKVQSPWYSRISICPASCADCPCNLPADPTEQHDLSATMPTVLSALIAELQMANRTLYDPPVVPNDPKCCVVAETKYGGFIGPFLP